MFARRFQYPLLLTGGNEAAPLPSRYRRLSHVDGVGQRLLSSELGNDAVALAHWRRILSCSVILSIMISRLNARFRKYHDMEWRSATDCGRRVRPRSLPKPNSGSLSALVRQQFPNGKLAITTSALKTLRKLPSAPTMTRYGWPSATRRWPKTKLGCLRHTVSSIPPGELLSSPCWEPT